MQHLQPNQGRARHRALRDARARRTYTPHAPITQQRYHYRKTPDGCKGGWTCAKHAPAGRGAEGRLRVNYRYYNPVDGRWTRRDPAVATRTGNLYSYVLSPIQQNDILGLMSLSACKSLVSKIQQQPGKFDGNIRRLMEDIKNRGCEIPRISCVCGIKSEVIDGEVYVTLGGYLYTDNSITLYSDLYDDAQSVLETLQHELVHAWQECNRNREKDPHDTCARVVQEELAAYRESGECQRKVRTGKASSVTQCMIDGAIGSACPDFCATESEARREAIRWLSSVDPSIYPNLP